MTFQEMFESAKKALLKAKKVDEANHIAVQVNVTGEGSGIFYVKASEGKLAVEPYDYMDNDAVMTVDSAVLLEALTKADTAALQMEGNAEKIAAFRVILESLPKPRKAAAKTATTTAKKTTTAAKKTAAKTETAEAKTVVKKTTSETKAAAKKPAADKTTAAPKTTKKATKK